MTLIDIPIIAVGLVLVMVAVRMFLGPSRADRAAAADLGFFCFIALAGLFGARADQPGAFDVILIATLTGFVGTLWMARLISRGDGSGGGTANTSGNGTVNGSGDSAHV